MNPTDTVIQFILNSRFEDLPPEVAHQAKRCTLDALGALLAGTDTPVARMMSDFAVRYYAGTEATIAVSGRQASPVGTVLANGFAANALDIDDGYRLVKGHPGACVLPVLITAAEMAPALRGRDFLTALVIGYEVAIRAGMIRHATYPIYHSSGSWGAVAGAAVVGRVLGFDRNTLRQAMGTAEYHAPIAPMMKGIAKSAMVKDSIGWGALVGMSSALLAKEGFTGIEPLFSDTPDPGWIDELGSTFRILDLYFKPYAACRWAQPAIAGALKVVREQEINPASIAVIRVRTFAAAKALSCAHPRDTEEAQYNLAFPVAAALLDGAVGPKQVLPPRLFDPDLGCLMDKVRVQVADEYEQAFPQKTFADVTVKTTDGREFHSGPMEPLWEPPGTLPTDADLDEKFRNLVTPVLGEAQTDRLLQTVRNLDQPEATGRFTEALQAHAFPDGNGPNRGRYVAGS